MEGLYSRMPRLVAASLGLGLPCSAGTRGRYRGGCRPVSAESVRPAWKRGSSCSHRRSGSTIRGTRMEHGCGRIAAREALWLAVPWPCFGAGRPLDRIPGGTCD